MSKKGESLILVTLNLDNSDSIKLSGFDQKAFSQLRIHQLNERINFHFASPFSESTEFGIMAYEVCFNDLLSLLSTIYSKLSREESEKVLNLQEDLTKIMGKKISSSHLRRYGRPQQVRSQAICNEIRKSLFLFRLEIEKLMEAHGFNPSKPDPRKAVVG